MPKVQMPQLGESVAEGTIGKWLKKPGDKVAKYEPIVEVITDKVNAEVPSPFEGTLTEILVQEGETVPNNTDIAVIEAAGEGAAATDATTPSPDVVAPAEKAEAAGEAAPAAGGHGPAGSDERPERQPAASVAVASAEASTSGNGAAGPEGYEGRMTPAVRRLAREHSVDLAQVQGTGHAGRVTRDDVLKFVEQQKAGGTPAAVTPSATTGPKQAPSGPPPPPAAADSLKAASPMRKAIAAQMSKSLAVPTAYTTIEVDMSGVVALRESVKRDYQAREGIGLTYDAIVAKAVVEALRRHPDFNAHYTDEGHWRRKNINLGVAVAVDDGLVVPVLKDADTLSIHGLNQRIRDLADRARSSRLRMEDVQGGTFTLDNTGWTGSMITNPIINVPEVAIITMESITKRPMVIETPQGDTIGIRPMMYMCMGIDHRATDGAQAGRFMADVKRWLESVDGQTAVW